MRTLTAHLLALGVAVVAVRAPAQSVTGFPPPAPSRGTEVNGTVRLPNGSLAGLNRSVLERFAALIVEEAEALSSANVRAVGRNVGVQLSRQRGNGVVQTLDASLTNDQGQFLIYLPSGTSADTCRLMLSVGSGQSLTRAFVYTTTEPIVVDYASETAVALVLGQVQQGADLCEFSTGEIRSLVNALRALPGDVTGADIFETNHNALLIAENDIPFRPSGVPTPVATVTPTPTRTPTPIGSLCIGDCNGDGAVTVNELVTGINIALGTAPVSACPALQCPSSGPPGIIINCFIMAVDNLLNGCPTVMPTPTPTPVNPVPGPYEASGLIHGPGTNEPEFLVGKLDIAIPLEMSGIPNMLFEYAVENSEWRSQSFEIVQTADPGGISASTFNLGVVFMGLSVRINGEVVQLFGSGKYFFDADLRLILFKVNLTGGGYTVTLTAIPANPSAPKEGK